MKINDKLACDSKAVYKADTVAGNKNGHGHAEGGAASEAKSGGMSGMLSDMETCFQSQDVRKGDKLYFEANYDLDKHPV
jgi:hypothetical protein